MPKVSWSFNINEKNHIIELEHGYFTGKRKITVDGRVILAKTNFKDFGSVHDFEIESQKFRVSIKSKFLNWHYFFEAIRI